MKFWKKNNIMKIGLFTSVYFNNIGNAFIDFGAEEQIRRAMPSGAELVKLSQCANFSASLGRLFDLKYNKFVNWLWTHSQKYINSHHDMAYSGVSTLDVFSPMKIAMLDYLVIPGCVLTTSFFKIYGRLLEDKTKQGCNLIFWAASGNYYSESELKCVRAWLVKLKPYSITFRDSVAYDYYKDYSSNVFNGIDNVFFVNLVNLPKCDTIVNPYCVINIDSKYNSKVEKQLSSELKDKNVIYTDHEPYPYRKIGKLAGCNIMCSDYPLDYLFLYKNVDVTYSDRVHACIPTLSFGNKAQLFSDSPRIALFENVGINIEDIKSAPIRLDSSKLKELQDRQINYLRQILV